MSLKAETNLKLKITTTPKELMYRECWTEYCRLSGTSEWAVNEGMDKNTELVLSEGDAREIGLID